MCQEVGMCLQVVKSICTQHPNDNGPWGEVGYRGSKAAEELV